MNTQTKTNGNSALAHITRMPPYTLAKFDIPANRQLISLAQNESMRAPSPLVIKAIYDNLHKLALYPDPEWTELRTTLSQLHDIDSSAILCGVGSMELIQCLAHAWLDSSAKVVTTQYAYAFIKTVAQYTNASIHQVQEEAFTVSVDNIIKAVDENTTMVFLANPGNPTGTRIPRAEIRKLRNAMPPNTLLVIDEAYAEFSDHLDEHLFNLTNTTRTVVLRTFSKAYGLAGVRVGWGVFEASIAEQVRKLLNPNNISVLSQTVATTCAQDQDYMRETCRLTAHTRDSLINTLSGAGLELPLSHTNFVLIPFKNTEVADRVDTVLRNQGMVMRNMAGYGLPHCHRLTILNEAEMTQVQQTLLSAIAEENTL